MIAAAHSRGVQRAAYSMNRMSARFMQSPPAGAAAATAVATRRARDHLRRPCRRRGAAVACHASAGAAAVRLVLYTKPDCPLCDGLKEKVAALIDRAAFMPSPLAGATLEVRDVSASAAWAPLAGSVPLLAALTDSGEEVPLPRPQPRLTADRLEKHLAASLQGAGLL